MKTLIKKQSNWKLWDMGNDKWVVELKNEDISFDSKDEAVIYAIDNLPGASMMADPRKRQPKPQYIEADYTDFFGAGDPYADAGAMTAEKLEAEKSMVRPTQIVDETGAVIGTDYSKVIASRQASKLVNWLRAFNWQTGRAS